MVVHQAKSQNHNSVLTGKKVDPIHGVDEVQTFAKQDFGIVAIGGEVPAVADRMVLAFDDGEADPQIRQNDFHSSRFFNSAHRAGCAQHKNGDNGPILQVLSYSALRKLSFLSHFRTVFRENGRFGALLQIGWRRDMA